MYSVFVDFKTVDFAHFWLKCLFITCNRIVFKKTNFKTSFFSEKTL